MSITRTQVAKDAGMSERGKHQIRIAMRICSGSPTRAGERPDFFTNKFIGKVRSIFSGLPKPKEWQSLLINDLPLLTTIDPKLAVHRSNNQNRDATPGQKAMAFAMQFPEGTNKGGRGKTSILDIEVSKPYITKARYVLRNSPMVEGERYPRRCLSANVNRRHNRRA